MPGPLAGECEGGNFDKRFVSGGGGGGGVVVHMSLVNRNKLASYQQPAQLSSISTEV